MVFSPQQIKFEFLSYIKEFGGKTEDWRVGCAVDAPKAMFEENKVDSELDVWLWKPALSPAAAGIVFRYMTDQLHVTPASISVPGSSIFLFKRSESAAD
ncbi:hypothetical protein ACFQI3_02290 [Hansschlegelia quercus]|uniref:Uncharacterized protein n=1 Tax=Hansschlegelia quercus TaxID=2528245 RepID=A0A4Q9GPP1_9HYPH|nr:hypothetical protein [Hansschlegelia quercus]TBN54764.1 hypothetical protein EYR15_00925 [Hansschlegelia quercus]